MKNAEEYVCVNEIGELLRPDYITSTFGKILKAHNLKHLKFHGLRHSVGSMLAQNNVNQAQIQAYLGHKNIRSSSIYMHTNYNSQVFSANVVSEQLQKASGQ